jgi:hypothetical protein
VYSDGVTHGDWPGSASTFHGGKSAYVGKDYCHFPCSHYGDCFFKPLRRLYWGALDFPPPTYQVNREGLSSVASGLANRCELKCVSTNELLLYWTNSVNKKTCATNLLTRIPQQMQFIRHTGQRSVNLPASLVRTKVPI